MTREHYAICFLIPYLIVTADYYSEQNFLILNSYDIKEDGEIESISKITIDSFIEFYDSININIAMFTTPAGNDAIMIETNQVLYSLSDGGDYHVYIIEIDQNGILEKICDEDLAGSGDVDITEAYNTVLNDCLEKNYSQDVFDSMVENGKGIIEQENLPIYATINFKSDASKLADENNWDGVNEFSSKIFFNNSTEWIYWGEGTFEAVNNW